MTFKLTLLLVILVLGNSAVSFTENDQLQSRNAKGSNLRTFGTPSFSVDTSNITPTDILADSFNSRFSRGSGLRTLTNPKQLLNTINAPLTDALTDSFISGLSRGSTASTASTSSTSKLLFSISTDEIDQFISLYQKLKTAGIFK